MSKRRKQTNTPVDMSFHGTALDRILNGMITPEIRKELYKVEASLPETPNAFSPTPFALRSPPSPLVAVFADSYCACGANHRYFSHFAYRVVTKVANGADIVTYKQAMVTEGDKPSQLLWQRQDVPYCMDCVPSGLAVVK